MTRNLKTFATLSILLNLLLVGVLLGHSGGHLMGWHHRHHAWQVMAAALSGATGTVCVLRVWRRAALLPA